MRDLTVATLILILLFSSGGQLAQAGVGEDSEERFQYNAVRTYGEHLDPGVWFRPALFHSVDFEFIPDSDLLLISEWPLDPHGSPVISTWKLNDTGIVEIGTVELAGNDSVVYDYASNQCGIPMAVRVVEGIREVFVGKCITKHSHHIEKYLLDDEGLIIPSSKQLILNITSIASWSQFHGIGEIEFGRGGALWVFNGYNNWALQAQDNHSLSGSILKFNIDMNGTIVHADDSPHSQGMDWNPLVYAKGVRMPWKAVEISENEWLFGDVGTVGIEEINRVNRSGMNFGYGYWGEGIDAEWNETGECPEGCEHLTDAILSYEHSVENPFFEDDSESLVSPNAAIMIGEIIPEGEIYPEHHWGKLIFSDFIGGWLRLFDVESENESQHLGHLGGVVDMEVAPNGYIYALRTGVQVAQDHSDAGLGYITIGIEHSEIEEESSFGFIDLSIIMLGAGAIIIIAYRKISNSQ